MESREKATHRAWEEK